MIPGKRYTLSDVVRIARQRVWLVVASILVVGVATAIGGRFLRDQYRAETLILVVPQRVPESYVKSTVTSRIEDRLPSISQQILSRTRLEQIIQDFDLYAAARQTSVMEDVVERMRRDINVEVVKGDAFRVSYIGDDPRLVMQVTQRLASLFIDENLRDREVMAENSFQFIESQLNEARRRLVEHEKKLEEYRRRYAGQLPSQLESNLGVIQSTQMQLQALNEWKARNLDRRLIVERAIADLVAPTSGVDGQSAGDPDGAGTTDAEQLAIAHDALRQMELRLTPEHPDVIRTKRVIATLTEKMEAERRAAALVPVPAPSPSLSEMARQNKLKELRAELENLSRQEQRTESEERRLREVVATYQERVEAAPARESDLIELTRDYDTLQKTYVSLLFKQEDSKIAANLERRQIGEQFKVLDPAQIPERPYSPNRTRLNLLGLLVGLLLGVGLAGLLEVTDSTLKTDDDVATALELPVLALVPRLSTDLDQWRARRARLLVAAASMVLMSMAVAMTIWKLKP